MELFIRIVNGKPFEHPILSDNFKQAFPNIDTDNLPSEFAKFVKSDPPKVGVYEVLEETYYDWKDNYVTEIHKIRDMTEEEKKQKQNAIKKQWEISKGFKSWIFNEEECIFEPPIKKPTDEKLYFWNEKKVNWEIFDPEKKE
jgi:hypothetical protein